MFNNGREAPAWFWDQMGDMERSRPDNRRRRGPPGNPNDPFSYGFNPFMAWNGNSYPAPPQNGPNQEQPHPPSAPEVMESPPSPPGPPPPESAHGPPPPSPPQRPEHERPHDHHNAHHRRGGGPFGRGGRHGMGRGAFGGPGGRHGQGFQHPFGEAYSSHMHDFFNSEGGRPPFDLGALGDMLAQQFGYTRSENASKAPKAEENGTDKDFSPPADIFDTKDAYVVHVSLAGAKREDVGCNWNADENELSVAGVIYRPGDEEMLKALALNERQVGVFERKIKLGSREKPAAVDSDGISAKMEDGVLVIRVPKIEEDDYVEVKKVDIQ